MSVCIHISTPTLTLISNLYQISFCSPENSASLENKQKWRFNADGKIGNFLKTKYQTVKNTFAAQHN